MRTIKFRAWDKDKKEIIAFSFPYFMNNHEIYKSSEGMTPFTHTDVTKKLELMQFTGLLDKNGKEIYENDLVSSVSHLPKVMQVEFIEGGFCMTHPTLEDYPIDINHFYPSIGTDLVVVGNIYENPNLIK